MIRSKNAKAIIVAVIASIQVMATTASAQQEQPVASKAAFAFQNKGTSDAVASIKCDSSDSLKELLKKAEEGTEIILKNGTYTVESLTIDRTGVKIIAETPGEVIFTGPTRIEIKGDKNVIKGIRFDACVGIGRASLVGIRGNENRITECAFLNCNPPAKETFYHWFGIDGLKNRVDHCNFAGQNHAGVTIVYSFDKGPGEHIFDHNYLKDRPKGHTDNGFETLRVGSSEYSHLNGKVTIENNLFENCDGEVEIISLKTSANIVRGNTFRNCFGWVTTRQCESTLIEGNYFIGNPGEEQVGGIRIIGPSHRVVNNYFEGLTDNHVLSLRAGNAQMTLGKLYEKGAAAAKGGGVGFVYQVSESGMTLNYQEVTNVLINQNIIVLGESQMAIWYNQSYGDRRESIHLNRHNTISQNIIYRTAGNARLFTNSAPPEIPDSGLGSTTFKDNIAYTLTGILDPGMSDSNITGFTFKNPELTRDKYGILRSQIQPDAGPKNPPLTPADVGPAWMKKKEEVMIRKPEYEVKSAGLPGGLGASVDASGNIMGVAFAASGLSRDVSASTRLAGCEVQATKVETAPGGGLLVRKTWKARDGHTFSTTESFSAAPAGIRWEITISDDAPAWSTEIETHFRYPAGPGVKWWTAWGSPYDKGSTANLNHEDVANAIIPAGSLKVGDWQDPLVAVPLRDSHYHYGAPPYAYDQPRTAFCPFQGDLFCIPLVSVMEEKVKLGLSIALSPEDLLLDLGLSTKADGTFVFQRLNHRIGGGRPVKFAMDLVAHQPDWRAALGWLVRRYPAFFDPVVPAAHEIAGTGAYTRNWLDFDVEKMKKMAFMLNWKASHDFPYMGMFLPPVAPDHTWPGFQRGAKEPHVSIARMADYAAGMRKHGFHVLSYFNVTEFGTDIKYPAPPRKAASDGDLWKDANDFLHARLADAILYTPTKQKPFKSKHYGLTEPDRPFWTWGKAVVLDPGEPVYQKHLLDQARRHILEIPDASGICIDRMDWLRMYNHRRDDGVSWFGGQAVRSLYTSWSDLMGKLGPVFHDKGKVIYVNNHIKRLEQMRFVDGIFDEFTYAGSPLNTIAFLGVRKPVMGWINKEDQFKPNADDAMQKYLYLGVFPMAPFPANDHSLHPSPWVDRLYLDYGPLLSAMRGKKWVLTPRCVETTTPGVKVNLFEVFGGYALPVAFAGKAETATVQVRDIPDLAKLKAVALHPGVDTPAPVASNLKDGVLTLTVPLVRGCAMVKLGYSDSSL